MTTKLRCLQKNNIGHTKGGASGNPNNSGELSTHECFLFEVTLEIKEKSETANTYDLVPRQKGIFKLRSNVEKKVVVSVQQISQNSCNLGTIHVLRKHFLAQNLI